MRKKKYITKGEEFYKKNKKKFNSYYEMIKATKSDIDGYYNNDIEIDELINSYHKLNSLKFMNLINYLKGDFMFTFFASCWGKVSAALMSAILSFGVSIGAYIEPTTENSGKYL